MIWACRTLPTPWRNCPEQTLRSSPRAGWWWWWGPWGDPQTGTDQSTRTSSSGSWQCRLDATWGWPSSGPPCHMWGCVTLSRWWHHTWKCTALSPPAQAPHVGRTVHSSFSYQRSKTLSAQERESPGRLCKQQSLLLISFPKLGKISLIWKEIFPKERKSLHYVTMRNNTIMKQNVIFKDYVITYWG